MIVSPLFCTFLTVIEDEITRKTVEGPALLIPKESEWVHKFVWHGSDPYNTNTKIPGALQFTKLRCVPDQLYFDVTPVRTKDDVLITVKLLIFFELRDIQTMLDKTHDPIADFINGVTSSVVSFAMNLRFDEFKDNVQKFSQLDIYKEFIQRANSIGYKIENVVFRGYEVDHGLQEMQNNAVEKRTKLLLEMEAEQQSQNLKNYILTCNNERIMQEQLLEAQRNAHNIEILDLQHKQRMKEDSDLKKMELEQEEAMNNIKLAYYKALKDSGVDLTKLLTAMEQKPDKLIQFNGGTSNETSPAVHYHIKE